MLLAVTMTAVGFAFDAGSGDKELSMVFAASYALGCIFAVLAVRQTGIFTAVIQPPLILFVAVPTAYFLFHGAQFTGIKDTLINFGYPLIERFPLMFFTSAAVLLIGMARWYYGMSSRRGAARSTAKETTSSSRVSSVTSKMSSLLTGEPPTRTMTLRHRTEPRRKHTIDRPSRPAKPAKAEPARRPQRQNDQARHTVAIAARPAAGDRDHRTRRRASPSAPHAPAERAAAGASRRAASPPAHVDARTPQGRARLPTGAPHTSGPSVAAATMTISRGNRTAANGNGTHHPVSRVRYRGGADDSDNRAEHRTRPRSSRSPWEADSWEYDI